MLSNSLEHTQLKIRKSQGSKLSIRKSAEVETDTMITSPRNKKGSFEIFPSISEEVSKTAKSPRLKVEKNESKTDRRRSSATSVNCAGGRRVSLATTESNSRPSFRSIGGKVTTLLRAKMAFKVRRKNAENLDKTEETIEDLPKEPRFSTSMSPEAQYAMMKGYEDTVYSYLLKEYPEYRLFLKRNRTPSSQLDMSEGMHTHKSAQQSQQHAAHKLRYDSVEEETEEDNPELTTPISPTSANSVNSLIPVATTLQVSERRNSTSVIPSSYNNVRKSARSSSVSVDKRNVTSLPRTQSLPSVLPLEKQLILTHRLQNAMDILDTVKGQLGMNVTSPRVKTNPGGIQPISDYNRWTSVWSQEFKVKSDAKINA